MFRGANDLKSGNIIQNTFHKQKIIKINVHILPATYFPIEVIEL